MPLLEDQRLFFRQFRERFNSTGAILPSSRFLARAMTGPMHKRERPARVLEIGPGTGAVTGRLVKLLGDGDRLDLVELNPDFAQHLKDRFASTPHYQRVADRSEVHVCPLEEFEAEAPYDYIISGLPLNNFPTDLVERIFECYFDLLAPGGTLSYFEYMYIRGVKRVVSKKSERQRLTSISRTMQHYIDEHRVKRSWVFVNVPPAWVQHLKKPEESAEPIADSR